jgi:hypothetical protein
MEPVQKVRMPGTGKGAQSNFQGQGHGLLKRGLRLGDGDQSEQRASFGRTSTRVLLKLRECFTCRAALINYKRHGDS